MALNKRKIGHDFEEMACKYLTDKNIKIITTNYSCRIGEIDIIAKDGDYLVFVEVKYRSNNSFGSALEAVTPAKQQKIRQVAQYFLTTKSIYDSMDCRFDVIGIEGAFDSPDIIHIENAF